MQQTGNEENKNDINNERRVSKISNEYPGENEKDNLDGDSNAIIESINEVMNAEDASSVSERRDRHKKAGVEADTEAGVETGAEVEVDTDVDIEKGEVQVGVEVERGISIGVEGIEAEV
ncbi:hypothetical protein PFNF54_02238 [Plasmodium falciparum NF54]|uniref:Uncharacterized protein n=1 Tax=Plasmodium falciparum (isolate NF54) TaxID=5843 RepID=W7JVE1_PLAFO|nr:hypothetical protein PFNF54_02238 [Plasmodium falciparum NF54]